MVWWYVTITMINCKSNKQDWSHNRIMPKYNNSARDGTQTNIQAKLKRTFKVLSHITPSHKLGKDSESLTIAAVERIIRRTQLQLVPLICVRASLPDLLDLWLKPRSIHSCYKLLWFGKFPITILWQCDWMQMQYLNGHYFNWQCRREGGFPEIPLPNRISFLKNIL